MSIDLRVKGKPLKQGRLDRAAYPFRGWSVGRRLGDDNGCFDGDRFNRPQMRRKIVHQIPRADIIRDSGSRLIIKNEARQFISSVCLCLCLYMFVCMFMFVFVCVFVCVFVYARFCLLLSLALFLIETSCSLGSALDQPD